MKWWWSDTPLAAHRAVSGMTSQSPCGEGLVLLAGLSRMGTSRSWELGDAGPAGRAQQVVLQRGSEQECNRMSVVMLQGQGPRPQCKDSRRPEASLNREGTAVHRTGYPGSL